MIHLGLFEGIGGFSLAAKWMGWNTLLTSEIAEFPRKVLQYYWPDAYHHGDIKTLNYETINTELSKRYGSHWRNDDIILTGGFPCQPYSSAGKRKGKEDERHLWPEMLRVIREVAPSYIVGENVAGLLSWSGGLVFEEVHADLENEGYEVQAYILPACSQNAPHKRERTWFVAHSDSARIHKQHIPTKSNEKIAHSGLSFEKRDFSAFPTEPPILRRDDGISKRLDSKTFSKWRNQSIKAYGNAIVPQVVYEIFKAIEGTQK